MDSQRILVLEETKEASRVLEKIFSSQDLDSIRVRRSGNTLCSVPCDQYDVIIIDFKVCDNSLTSLLSTTKQLPPRAKVIVAVDEATQETTLAEIRSHGFILITKPFCANVLLRALDPLGINRALNSDPEKLLHEIEKISHVLDGQSTAIELLTRKVSALLPSSTDDLAPQKVDHKNSSESRTLDYQLVRFYFSLLVDELTRDGVAEKYESQLTALGGLLKDVDTFNSKDFEILKQLSSRELRIMSMIESGKTTEEIAELLHISPDTVKTHRRNIRRKLDIVGDKNDLASYLRLLHSRGPT